MAFDQNTYLGFADTDRSEGSIHPSVQQLLGDSVSDRSGHSLPPRDRD